MQDQLYALNYNDPVTMALKITIEKLGSLELSKLNEEGNLIDGAIYQVDGPSGYSKEVTITNGRIKLENLKVGTYTVKEKKLHTLMYLIQSLILLKLRQMKLQNKLLLIKKLLVLGN